MIFSRFGSDSKIQLGGAARVKKRDEFFSRIHSNSNFTIVGIGVFHVFFFGASFRVETHFAEGDADRKILSALSPV